MKSLALLLLILGNYQKHELTLNGKSFDCMKYPGIGGKCFSDNSDLYRFAEAYCNEHEKSIGMYNGVWDQQGVVTNPTITISCKDSSEIITGLFYD